MRYSSKIKPILPGLASFEAPQETLALLKILALGNQQVAAGKVKPLTSVVACIRARRVAAC